MIVLSVPSALKKWFIAHFIIDLLFAIPLFIAPVKFLELFHWQTIDPFAARIVAAALFGIGIESFLGRNAGADTYRNMLNLKIIWSGAVIIGIIFSMYESPSKALIAEWLVLLTFLIFNFVWTYWRYVLHKYLPGS